MDSLPQMPWMRAGFAAMLPLEPFQAGMCPLPALCAIIDFVGANSYPSDHNTTPPYASTGAIVTQSIYIRSRCYASNHEL